MRNVVMKYMRLIGCVAVFLIAFALFPVNAEANLKLNETYKEIFDPSELFDCAFHDVKIKEPGIYNITISYDGRYERNWDDETVSSVLNIDPLDSITFYLDDGTKENSYEIEAGTTKTIKIGLDKGTYTISSEEELDWDYNYQYTIKVSKAKTKNVSLSKAYKYVKKNKKSHMKATKKSKKITVAIDGVADTVDHARDGYYMLFSSFPVIQIDKQGKTTTANYYLNGQFLIYGVVPQDDSDLTDISIYSGKNKMKFDLDYSKEKNGFDYVDLFYKDTCKYKCTLFKNYKNPIKDINKLIKIIKSKNAKIKIKGDSGAYFTIKLSSKTRKKWVDSLNLYKKIVNLYK